MTPEQFHTLTILLVCVVMELFAIAGAFLANTFKK